MSSEMDGNNNTGDMNNTMTQVEMNFLALQANLDQFFLLTNGMIVLLMQCGFAFLEAGAVRSKNSTNILIKNLMDQFFAGISYWLVGYAFAFGKGHWFIGYTYWASADMPEEDYALFFFQYVFAATAATIVSGAVAERCEFIAYIIYSVLITGFIYPVVTHWVWYSDGWLGALGYLDFAGSGVVHVLGGVAAFIAAFFLGPRKGRFHKSSKTVAPIRGHSVPLAALGGFILLFGFLAFNGGSQTSISKPGDGAAVSLAVVNTVISGSTSALFTLVINRAVGNAKWSLLTTLNGALAGMVAICAGCNVFYPWAACIVGFFAAISYRLINWSVTRMWIDDPLDAVAVHFGGGSWGVIAVAFLHKERGIIFNFDNESGLLLGYQLAGLLSIAAWTAVTSILMFGGLKLAKILRVSPELEAKGLDIPKHGEPAYPTEAYGHGWEEKIAKILEQVELTDAAKSMSALSGGFAKAYLNPSFNSGEKKQISVSHDDVELKDVIHDQGNGKIHSPQDPDQKFISSIDVKM